MNTIVVTRHRALVQFLAEVGLIEPDTPVISHAKPEDVAGKRVIGVLPLSLAALADEVVEVPLHLTEEMRGQELDLATMRQIAGVPVAYKVIKQ